MAPGKSAAAELDQDNKGLQDAIIKLDDGSTTKLESDKETIQLRCIEPGHYDAAVNLYAYRVDNFNQKDRTDLGLKVHCEIVAINPSVHLVFAKDVTLDRVGQTINWALFDLDRAGTITLTGPPVTPITDGYMTKAPCTISRLRDELVEPWRRLPRTVALYATIVLVGGTVLLALPIWLGR